VLRRVVWRRGWELGEVEIEDWGIAGAVVLLGRHGE